jgi:hypothetical protein
MEAGTGSKALDLPAFARLHDLRAPRIAWLFGAGVSAAAGVPTAAQMTWEFKALLYATEKTLAFSGVDLADPNVRAKVQSHFNAKSGCPPDGGVEEYGFYFERAYPAAADRRAYIDRAISRGTPGFGHLAFATLMLLNKVGVVWTTNFDRLVEDAAAQVMKTTRSLVISGLNNAEVAGEAIRDSRFPLYVKLHGDFQSERLMNLPSELQSEDDKLRQSVRRAAGQFGLAIAGYSGRDASVMAAIRDGLAQSNPYPQGIYWFIRDGDAPLSAVTDLLDEVRTAGVEAHLVPIPTFDALMGTLLTPLEIPASAAAALEALRPKQRIVPFTRPATSTGSYPVIRLNALEVQSYPNTARRIACEIGGTKEVREALEAAGSSGVGHRRHDGVIAFGPDGELRRAFAAHKVSAWDIAPIEPMSGRPSDLALTYDAIARALARERPFRYEPKPRLLYVDEAKATDAALAPLKAITGSLYGAIPGTSSTWAEAVRLSLQAHLGSLWLVFEPAIWASVGPVDSTRFARATFIKSRTSGRFNEVSNSLFDAWSKLLGSPSPISSFGIDAAAGLDATFVVANRTVFSRRGPRR